MTIKVLIIDDEEEMCWALEKALSADGYEVKSVTNGIDGLKTVTSEEFALVLLDIMMPGMDGLTLLENIQKLKPEIPVLIMTGYSSMPTALEAIQKGATGYLTKPFSILDLKTAVKNALSTGDYPGVL